MEIHRGLLYNGGEIVKELCLLGKIDDFSEITIGNDGKMVVKTLETVKSKEGNLMYERREYQGINRIKFT